MVGLEGPVYGVSLSGMERAMEDGDWEKNWSARLSWASWSRRVEVPRSCGTFGAAESMAIGTVVRGGSWPQRVGAQPCPGLSRKSWRCGRSCQVIHVPGLSTSITPPFPLLSADRRSFVSPRLGYHHDKLYPLIYTDSVHMGGLFC